MINKAFVMTSQKYTNISKDTNYIFINPDGKWESIIVFNYINENSADEINSFLNSFGMIISKNEIVYNFDQQNPLKFKICWENFKEAENFHNILNKLNT